MFYQLCIPASMNLILQAQKVWRRLARSWGCIDGVADLWQYMTVIRNF
jgi:hypothetical protein